MGVFAHVARVIKILSREEVTIFGIYAEVILVYFNGERFSTLTICYRCPFATKLSFNGRLFNYDISHATLAYRNLFSPACYIIVYIYAWPLAGT